MLWINFLHIYQPANADAHIIKEATEKSYLRIIRALEEHPTVKFTMNINGCLILRWDELGYQDLIRRLARLVKLGKIELTGTAAYHPIIPLVPEKETKAQIREHEEILRRYIGVDYKPRGFFFPEMAYSPQTARIIKKLGYEWIILDEIAIAGKEKGNDCTRVYTDSASKMAVVARCRDLSNSYVPEAVTKMLADPKSPETVITATDGELYGLRHNDPKAVFEKLLTEKNLQTKTISEFADARTERIAINPPAHSWVTSERELKKGEPFNLWQEKTNTVQKKLWQLAQLAYNTIEDNRSDVNYHWARWHFVRGLASCTFWWASARDFQKMFGPISWNPDQIERGSNELIRSIRALDNELTRETKVKAEKLYLAVKKMVWERHWVYYWKKT